MDWQLPTTIAFVLVAAAFVLRSTWHTWAGSKTNGCGSGCGKCATTTNDTAANPKRISLPQV